MSGRQPTERFTTRARDYARWRPGYPAGMIDTLVRRTGLTPAWVVADLGAGTGLSAEPFLARGHTVYAVEPNAAMREMAEHRLAGRPGFRSVAGTAESTGLPAASVDLVVAAQAFHWFDPDRARAESRRILRPGGWAAVAWNARRTDATPFLRAYEALVRRFGTDYREVRPELAFGDRLERFFAPGYVQDMLEYEQVLDLEGLTGRLLSCSYMPEADDPARGPALRAIEAMFREHQVDGRVRLEYDTELYIGRPGEPAPGPRC